MTKMPKKFLKREPSVRTGSNEIARLGPEEPITGIVQTNDGRTLVTTPCRVFELQHDRLVQVKFAVPA